MNQILNMVDCYSFPVGHATPARPTSPSPDGPATISAAAGPDQTGGDFLADQPSPVASFTLPTPPSVNALYKNVPGKGRVKAGLYDDFIRRGVASIRAQKVPGLIGRVVILFAVERMSKMTCADIDNRLKAMLDTMVVAGVIEDDQFVTAIFVTWAPPANGLAHVQVFRAGQPITVTFHPSPDGASGGFYLPRNPEGETEW